MKAIAHLDLVRLAESLAKEGKHPKLVQAVERAAAAGSIRHDLQTASAALAHIEAVIKRSPIESRVLPADYADGMVIGALFTQAVVLYARATATQGKRPKLLGEAKLTASQRATHDEAMALRNSAVTHYGRGEILPEGPLVREAVVISLMQSSTGPKHRVGAYTSFAQHKAAFSARLAALLVIRLAEIDARSQPLFDQAYAALDAELRGDPMFAGRLRGFEFDVEAFCASPSAAAEMLAQLEAGEVQEATYVVATART